MVNDEWSGAEALENAFRVADEELRKVERERDEAVARAEAAEKRHTWPKTTPTGHTYVEPNTYAGLRHRHGDAAQAEIECWEAAECPPEPTWEMVGIAHREVERIQRDLEGMKRDYCECQEELVEASLERDQWMARAEAAESRTTVSRADVEEALDTWLIRDSSKHQSITDDMCELFGVEGAQADPVEEQTDALAGILYGDELVTDQMRDVLKRVVRAGMLFPGQEDRHVDQ